MIIKGKSRAAAGQLSTYLLKQGKNESVRFIGAENVLANDLRGALLEMQEVAAGTNCEQFLYHASINPQKGEKLTPEQWLRSVEILEKDLHLEGHQRAIVEHVKDGREHFHIVWNRIDLEKMTAQKMGWSYVQHEKASRQIENEFGFERIQGVHVRELGEKAASRAPTRGEIAASKRDKINIYAWRQEIRDIEKGTETGPELIAALEAKGYAVARGDKVSFMILDPAGRPHRMAQSLGMRVKDFQERMAGVDPENLPTVEIAERRAQVHRAGISAAQEVTEPRKSVEEERLEQAKKDAEKGAAILGATLYDRANMTSQQEDALRHHKDRTTAKEAARTAEQERQRRGQDQQEKAQKASGDDKPKDQGEVKRDERKARTEQTVEQMRQAHKEAMRELFESKFGKGHNSEDREKWGRERERER